MSGPTKKDFRIAALIEATRDSYMFETYGRTQWWHIISWLTRRRYTDAQIKAILYSRFPRFVQDAKGQASAAAFTECWEDLGNFGGTKQGRQEYVDQAVAAQTPEVKEDPAELVAEAAAYLKAGLHEVAGTPPGQRYDILIKSIKSALEKIEGAQAAGLR